MDLLDRARAGDGEAFRELVAPYQRELHVHCYRMLGSVQDAEDALQDTLLSAWQGLAGFEGRASLRTWLYRGATSRGLDARRSARRRPRAATGTPEDDPGMADLVPPEPTRLGEVLWLEPYPDDLLAEIADVTPGPEARYESAESISLARKPRTSRRTRAARCRGGSSWMAVMKASEIDSADSYLASGPGVASASSASRSSG